MSIRHAACGTRFNRRGFLRTALAGGSATTLGLATRARPVSAAVPIRRNGKPRLKLSLAAYSFRNELTRKVNPMHLDEFVKLCAELNLDGTELTSYYFPKGFDEAYLLHLKELTFRLGLDISGTAIRNDYCLPPGAERDKWLAHTRQWIDYSAILGAPVIRIFAGNVPAGDTEDAAIERCAAGINESLDYAAKKGVYLALENHGGITSTPKQMLKIIAGVQESPWFGVNLDAGNFRTANPYEDLAKIAPYAVNAQIKTDLYPSGQREDTDITRVVGILANAGYRGYVALEYEAKEDPRTAVPRHLQSLRKAIQELG